MPEILAPLQNIAPLLEKTTYRQLSQVIFGMLVISGRITMLGLSRWTEKGGSYRTIQRLYHSVLPWKSIQWMLFQRRFLKAGDEYLIAGDEVVLGKAGKETHGLDRFFSGIQQHVIPGLSFFAFSLVNVREEQSYPLQITQIVKSVEEKAASKAKAEAKKVKGTGEKKKRGRPKCSKNKDKQAVILNPELMRIQKALKSLLETVGSILSQRYVITTNVQVKATLKQRIVIPHALGKGLATALANVIAEYEEDYETVLPHNRIKQEDEKIVIWP